MAAYAILPECIGGANMAGFVEGVGRSQSTLFTAQLDDSVDADNPVRVVDAFVAGLACNTKRVISVLAGRALPEAMQA